MMRSSSGVKAERGGVRLGWERFPSRASSRAVAPGRFGRLMVGGPWIRRRLPVPAPRVLRPPGITCAPSHSTRRGDEEARFTETRPGVVSQRDDWGSISIEQVLGLVSSSFELGRTSGIGLSAEVDLSSEDQRGKEGRPQGGSKEAGGCGRHGLLSSPLRPSETRRTHPTSRRRKRLFPGGMYEDEGAHRAIRCHSSTGRTGERRWPRGPVGGSGPVRSFGLQDNDFRGPGCVGTPAPGARPFHRRVPLEELADGRIPSRSRPHGYRPQS
jgi:hypothetical protein